MRRPWPQSGRLPARSRQGSQLRWSFKSCGSLQVVFIPARCLKPASELIVRNDLRLGNQMINVTPHQTVPDDTSLSSMRSRTVAFPQTAMAAIRTTAG